MLYQILQINYFLFHFNKFLMLYMNMLRIPHFNWKRRKFIGQNKVKICKLRSQNFKFLGQKLVALEIRQPGGIPYLFRPWSSNLLVSVGQTTSQRIDYFYVNEEFTTSEHRAPASQSWLAMVSFTVYCIVYGWHITPFFRLRNRGPPKWWEPQAVAQSAPP